MDLYNVATYLRPKSLQEVPDWQSDWNWLAGGTWIFNEVQPQVKTLVDMQWLNWSEIEVTCEGLSIGATCIQNDLLDLAFPQPWTATEALKDAVRELASFKLSHAATVGGNICLALSASTFAPRYGCVKCQLRNFTTKWRSLFRKCCRLSNCTTTDHIAAWGSITVDRDSNLELGTVANQL